MFSIFKEKKIFKERYNHFLIKLKGLIVFLNVDAKADIQFIEEIVHLSHPEQYRLC